MEHIIRTHNIPSSRLSRGILRVARAVMTSLGSALSAGFNFKCKGRGLLNEEHLSRSSLTTYGIHESAVGKAASTGAYTNRRQSVWGVAVATCRERHGCESGYERGLSGG